MSWLNHHHAQFESVVNRCSAACDAADRGTLDSLYGDFVAAYRRPVELEESVLFPAY